ncbi:HD domain-containing protein [Algoriphagus aquimarinus]|uniref:HD domain-containing protein n=1 Tax=Algoriphagus aquimarinus TaxID=237018 RepID=A0A1I0V9K6_9BACT|nr:HD domain-containing protein [Algoriphagus aquimarinus]SFA72733.1 HD domain-containing protein [Algoriphagus aquimarinus]
MQGYRTLRKRVLSNLEANLPKSLTYHALDHTLDVLNVCNQYIRREKLSEEDRYLLRMGAIVHDMGFLKGSSNHEEVGAGMAEIIMKDLGVKPKAIEQVKGLVMATKIPQSPKNHLQRIICDADLDYLGRQDYPEISEKLFEELKNMNVISTPQQWKDLQINFLKAHQYHTPFAIKNREPQKQIWLKKLLAS